MAEATPNHLANLRRLAYFAAVVEAGSFTAAAERLGITKAVVSQQVAHLERDFRATLLTRSTRKLVLTDAGKAFYERCATILREAGQAFDELAEVAVEPSGTLRLTATLDYGISAVVPAIAEFRRRYPQCKVDAVMSDQPLDMMSGQVELAIRIGWLTDLNVNARQIGMFQQMLVAAPHWARHAAHFTEPREIEALPFVANKALREPTRWQFSCNDLESQWVVVDAAIAMDETLAVREAVRHGAGLSVLPDFTVADDLKAGTLVQVLPRWSLPCGGIHAVYPASRFRSAKVQAFVDVLQASEQARTLALE